jgi:gliding motility-associated-like protein
VKYAFILSTFCVSLFASAQMPSIKGKGGEVFVTKGGDVYGTQKVFIKNIGQYDVLQKTYRTEKILFGYEGLGMPILLTRSGMVHVQRKFVPIEKEIETKKKEKEGEEENWKAIEKAVTMKWVGANGISDIVQQEAVKHHFTYGFLLKPAKAFRRLTYQKLYPGIDLHYSFDNANEAGIEFSLMVQPGANLNLLKWAYSGDVQKISKDDKGNLLIYSSIDTTVISAPKAFYANNKANELPIEFKITGNTVQFSLPLGYDKRQTLVIDPFISNTANLTGNNATIAKDIDFDYEGNIYVSGGGSFGVHMLAKYSASGVHQWTFNGGPIVVAGFNWNFGSNYGGFMVDKKTGKIYLSQGWNTGGVRVARLSTMGVFDNYMTAPNTVFSEGWRILWDCNNGNAQMLVAGGGSSSNLDFGIFSPPSLTMTTQNITGLPSFSQDIADAVIDPRNHEMYTIFSHGHQPPNDMYKHAAPYGVVNKLWNKSSGFTVLVERNNRPYLTNGGNDNAVNSLALNASYLFYWNGKNLKAFNKSTGDVIGTPLVTTDTVLRQGGIIADECGNVFVGARQGTVKVYKFDGTSFDDAAAPDITVPGFTNHNSVYDLAYDDARRMLYICGRGFVASFDVSSYCAQATYQVKLTKNCSALTVKAELNPAVPPSSTLDYTLYANRTEISSNTTGNFTGLTLGTAYTVKAFINKSCSGIQAAVDFVMGGPGISIAKTPACGSNGSLTITATGGTMPYGYSLDGINFQTGSQFVNLTAAPYTVTVKDALGCITTTPVAVDAGSNCVTATVMVVDERCAIGNGSITVTATNGTPPYSYSIDGINFQSSNLFSNLSAGNYTVIVKDATDGSANVPAPLRSISNNNLGFTFTATTGTCAGKDGSLAASGSGGALPYQFNLDAGLFANIDAGNHTLTIKDANGCTFSQPAIVPLINTLTADAGPGRTICEGESVALNATSNGNNFLWSPAGSLSSAVVLQLNAAPVVTTKYYLTAKLGPCTVMDSVTIIVNPAPKPFAQDTTICFGQSVVLQASGGLRYTWSPATYLSSTTIADPQVTKPASTIRYTIHSVGANNCVSVQPGHVTVTVDYRLKIFAGNDTAAVENEPLQLQAIDRNNNPAIIWLWTPAAGLSNPAVANPVFLSDRDGQYLLTATTPDGCESQDSLIVLVYKFADIFVPTAFSPNGDGKNEVLKAVPVGIKHFQRFSVYNRWGQLVFTTSQPWKGWDGKINGQLQASGVFVWIASGIDFKGKRIERKGTSVLIR